MVGNTLNKSEVENTFSCAAREIIPLSQTNQEDLENLLNAKLKDYKGVPQDLKSHAVKIIKDKSEVWLHDP